MNQVSPVKKRKSELWAVVERSAVNLRYLDIEIPLLVIFERKISQAAMEEIMVGHKGKKPILTLNDERNSP